MTKLTLHIPGSLETESMAPKLGGGAFKDIVRAKTSQRYRLEATRAADAGTTLSANSDDVVELELDGGIRIWTTLAQLQQDFPGSFKRGASSDIFSVPLALPIGERPDSDPSARGARGLGRWALKALRLIDVDLESSAAAAVARKLESNWSPAPVYIESVAPRPSRLRRRRASPPTSRCWCFCMAPVPTRAAVLPISGLSGRQAHLR